MTHNHLNKRQITCKAFFPFTIFWGNTSFLEVKIPVPCTFVLMAMCFTLASTFASGTVSPKNQSLHFKHHRLNTQKREPEEMRGLKESLLSGHPHCETTDQLQEMQQKMLSLHWQLWDNFLKDKQKQSGLYAISGWTWWKDGMIEGGESSLWQEIDTLFKEMTRLSEEVAARWGYTGCGLVNRTCQNARYPSH